MKELDSRSQEPSYSLELALLLLNHYPCRLFVFSTSLLIYSWCDEIYVGFDLPVDFSWVFAALQVQEVVLSADIRCAECQKRVAEMISKLNGEISIWLSDMSELRC